MKGNKKKKIAVGIVLLFLSASILTAAPNTNIKNFESDGDEDQIILKLKLSKPNENFAEKERKLMSKLRLFKSREMQYTTLEERISIPSDISNELVTSLENLNQQIEKSTNQEEKIALYSDCLRLLRNNDILPDSFTMDALLETTHQLREKISENKDAFPSWIRNRLPKNSGLNDVEIAGDEPFPLDNNVNQGETRLDIGSAFFIFMVLSEMTPWNVFIPFLFATGNETVFNMTDFPIGRALAEVIPYSEDYTFPVGWTAAIGYAELLAIPGNALIGGEALFSWPRAIPMLLYIYSGASVIIPIAYGTASLTILLDRGPRQVPIPLIDIGIFGSILTVHMPYAREPN